MTNQIWVASYRDGVATHEGIELEFATKAEALAWIQTHISLNSRIEDKWTPKRLFQGSN